jgi:cytochrome c oxidase cbb3-type subunit III
MSLKAKSLSLFKYLLFIILFSVVQSTFAQTEGGELTKSYYDIVAVAIIFVVVLIVVGFLYFGLGEEVKRETKLSLGFTKIKDYVVGLKPLEKEKDIMFDHAYDEIRELDNKIPPWFNYLFYGSVIFGIFYMINYHILSPGDVQATEYIEEVKFAEMQKVELIKSGALLDENKLTALTDAAALNSGKEIFVKNCTVCHTEKGGGLVGPNLTDDYWIHGGGIKNVFAVIKEGVPAKGMISWKAQLNPRQIQEVSSFVLSLKGTNPPNPKAPEGVLYVQQDTLRQ